ncbi:MAG: LAGLIDADG family homing endonuclease [Nitrososphaeria archaeon]
MKSKFIRFPVLSSPLLSYETGFSVADGCLYYRKLKHKTDYCVCYYGHIVDEIAFFNEVLTKILNKLYGIDPIVRTRKEKGTCEIVIYSKDLFKFKHEIIGLPYGFGNKIKGIPSFILNDRKLLIEFMSGLFDGEASFSSLSKGSSNNQYPRIKFEMSNYSLVHEVMFALQSLGINTTKLYERRKLDNRTNHLYITWYFNINGSKNCKKLVDTLNLKNPKHIRKCEAWIDYGKKRRGKGMWSISLFQRSY